MALHELGTNALKYGSLSKLGGKVSVEWAAHGEDQTHLTLTWQESGGPPVEPPRRKGFGARLIERQLASELDGQARIDFLPSGTVCTLTARLPECDEVHRNVVAA